MKTRVSVIVCFLMVLGATYGWAGKNIQVNAVLHQITYPFSGTGGTDSVRANLTGVSLRFSQGNLLTGTLKVAALFPYKYEKKIYPATEYVNVSGEEEPFVLDTLLGIGYVFALSEVDIYVGTGVHVGAFLQGVNSIISYGAGLDVQALVRWGKVFTLSAGVNSSLDFGSVSTVSRGKIDGLIWGLGFSFGVALSF